MRDPYYDRKKKFLSGGLWCCVSFWFWREIGFGCTYYYVLGVPYSCGVVLFFWFWQEIVFSVRYVLSVQYSCAVVSVFLLWQESFITTGKESSSRLSGGLCCCVSFWFWQEIGRFWLKILYYYVLGVPYSCGVVLVFLVLAGNRFCCYVRTWCTIQLCGCVSFSVVAGKFYHDRKKKF